MYKQKFKCEDLSMATQIFDKGYYLFIFDLKSGYHHIVIFPDHRIFFALGWNFGTGIFKYFRALVSLQKSRRSQGIPTAIFLHNGLGGEADHLQAKTNSLTVLMRSPFKLSRGLAFIST